MTTISKVLPIQSTSATTTLKSSLSTDPALSISNVSESLEKTSSSSSSSSSVSVPSIPHFTIPTSLTLHAKLPKPASLPSVSEMSAHDLVRELTAVHCMRDAETAAAIESLENGSGSSIISFLQSPASNTSSSISFNKQDSLVQGNMEIKYKEDDDVVVDDDDGLMKKTLNRFQIVAETSFSSSLNDSVNSNDTPSISFSIEIPNSLDVSTLAFDIPRLQMTANEPTVGPAPARNALKALKMFVASYVNSSPDFLQQIGEKRFVSLAQMRCRAWPHSELSPSQSESRVQAMLERLRSLTGYEFYVPIASLAQTRLGSSHVPFMSSVSSKTSAVKSKGHIDRGGMFSPLSLRLPTTGATSNSSIVTFVDKEKSPKASLTTNFFSPQQSAITPSGTSSALSFVSNTSRFFATTPGGPLLRPQVTTATLPSSLTPPANAQRALARFVSRYDKSRSRTVASPATFDREYHTPLLRSMQTGLDAMVAQRREEEAHMARATLVRPQKHPQGGYYYVSVETGRAVPPHDYEKVYLSEVNFATEFINAQAIEGWTEEAATRAVELASMTTEERAVLTEKEEEAKAQKVAWWDQDVEEGVLLLPEVNMTSPLSNVESAKTFSLGESIAHFISSWLSFAKEAEKKKFVKTSSEQTLDKPISILPLSSLSSPTISSANRIIDDQVAIVAARAAKLLLPAGAPSPSSSLLTGVSSTDSAAAPPSDSESALWASVAAAVAVYVNSQKREQQMIEDDTRPSGSFMLSSKGLEAEIDRLLAAKIDSTVSTFGNNTVVLDVDKETAESLGPQVEAVLDDAIQAFTAANDAAKFEQDTITTSESSGTQTSVLSGISLHLLPNIPNGITEVSASKKKSPFKSSATTPLSSLQEEAPLETWSPSEVEVASSSLAVKRLFAGSPVNALRSSGFKSIAEPTVQTSDVITSQPKPFSLSLESSLFTSLDEDDGETNVSSPSVNSRPRSSSNEQESSQPSSLRIELLSFETRREGLSPSTADDDVHSTFESTEDDDKIVEESSFVSVAPASPERIPASIMKVFSPHKRVATTPSSSSSVYREYDTSSPQMIKQPTQNNTSTTTISSISATTTPSDLVLPAIKLLSSFNGSTTTLGSNNTANVLNSPPPLPPVRTTTNVRLQPIVSPISTVPISSFSHRAATAISSIIFDENFTVGSRMSLPAVSTLKPITSPINLNGTSLSIKTNDKVSSPDLLFFKVDSSTSANVSTPKSSRPPPRPLNE